MAQNLSGYNWYFGNSSQGIRFSRSDNSASLVNNQATPFGTGGSAVASDQTNANLLFYTDGNRVLDVTHSQMPNGGGLVADATQNQPVVITKIPDQANQYYIFHRDAGGTVFFSIVDMNQFGNAIFPTPALGDVTTKNSGALALTGRSDGMIVIPHVNQDDFWLITHANGAPDYTVTLITSGGVFTNTVFSGFGLIEQAANFSYHAQSGRIAVSPREDTRDIEIVNFDNATGILSFNQTVLNTGVATIASGQAIYDTEWSQNGQYLYISRHGEPGIQADVLQYDIINPFTTLTSVLPQPNSIFRSYGLQMGPDSVIYHLYQAVSGGPFLMAAITNTDTVATEVGYNPQAFGSNINFSATQFPSFAPSDTLNLTVSFTSLGTCSNMPTSFFPTVIPTADSLRWNFGDGGGTSDWSPVYTYTAGGAYPVTVTAYLNGDSAQFTQNVTITQFDLQITLVQDTTACSCELPFPKAPNPPPQCGQFTVTAQISGTPLSTQWFGPAGLMPTQTTATLTPDSAGYYYIVVTDATGCSAYAGVNIKEYGVQDQRANIWHFGQNAGIDFNPAFDNPPGVPLAITGPVTSPEGSATISDRNGQVIFSTDGQNIYDRTGADITPAPNPPGLGGEPGATQSSIIIPVPGDETLYYIFTTQEVQGAGTYELRYSLFDLKLNGGLGGIVEYNVLLFEKSTERITSDGNWLIAHEYGNNSFRAYQITSLGISNPVISSIGSDHVYTAAENGQGYMELGGNNQLAVALSTPGVSNVVEVFDFDPASGVVSNFRRADLNNPNGQVYGLEFSGAKLLTTLKNAVSSQIVEFFFDSLNVPYLVDQPPITVNEELGAIQVGPDGQIYVAVNGDQFLGTIQVNPDTTQVSVYTPNGFQLAGGTASQLGLPNFIQIIVDPVQGPGIFLTGVCEDDSVSFSGTPTDPIDVFFWQVRQGANVLTTSDQSAFNFFFPDPGSYEVSLRLTNRCGLDTTITQPFTIFANPPTPTFLAPGDFPVLCSSTLQLEALPADDPDLSYLWSTGDTTRVIAVNQQALYSVVITSSRGCSSTGALIVADNRPIVNLPPNTTLCQNTPVFPLDAQNPVLGTTYVWTINGGPLGNAQTQSVSTALAGVFEYEVTVTSPGGPGIGCSAKDSTIYTINPSPVFTATPFNTTACGANDGRIELNITTPVTTLFSYFIVGPSPTVSGTDQPPGIVTTPSTLLPGTYGVSVADQVSGCATITTVPISDNAFTITSIVQQNVCDPVNLIVTHTAVGNFNYRVIDALTAQVVATGGPISGSPFTITGINAGTYVVEMTTTPVNCTFSSLPQTFSQGPLVTVTGFTSNACTNPITITVNGGTSWAWTGPNIVGSTTAQTISANPPQGSQTYTVRASQPGLCPIDVPVTVDVNNNIVADFTQTDACADQVTLEASPAGPYTYRWYRAGVQIPGGQFISAALADNGVQYRVEVVNALSGCVFTSTAKPVLVAGDLQLSLATTNPCEGSPFTLSTTVNQPGATYVWRLDGDVISGQTASTLTDTRGGMYEVTATVGGCSETMTMAIMLAPVTPGRMFDTALICPEPANPDPDTREIVLDPGADFISYNWFKDGVTLGYTDPTFTADEAGIFSVDLVNVFLCASSDRTTVEVDCEPRIVAPTAFRPASSLDPNKEFGVLTFFIDDTGFQIFIFNRWGEMVYQSSEKDFRWNGGYKNNAGQLLPAGTYTYVVRYKSSYRPEDGIQEKRGGVVLVR